MPPKLSFPIVIELAKALVMDAHGRKLPDAEIASLQCAWENIDYLEFENDSTKFTDKYSQYYRFPEKTKRTATLNSSSSRILRVFSKHFGRKLTRYNFRRNIQELWDENQIDISSLDLESVSIEEEDEDIQLVEKPIEQDSLPVLIERDLEIQYVEDLLEQYPIINLYGAPGIGKTTFAKQLGKYIENTYTVYYSDLRYIEDFREWGYELLSQSKVSDEIDSDRLIAKLSESLESKPSLIFIDSVVHLDREFSGFFETISVRNKQSVRFILLSTRKLNVSISSQYVYFYNLSGLKETKDINRFFQSLGLKSPEYWEEMNQFYEGNFRQIIYASKFINDFFDGDVKAYWKSNSRVFSPDITQNFDAIKFSPLDMDIFSMFAEEDNVISINIVQGLKKDSRTSEIWTRINYLCDLGYLKVGKEEGTQRLTYAIAPLLKSYLIRENKI